MQAIVVREFGEPGVLHLEEVPAPRLAGPDDPERGPRERSHRGGWNTITPGARVVPGAILAP